MLKNLKQFNLPAIEEEVLRFWKTNDVFEQSLKRREGKKHFRFFEGPPYVNGRPGIHHILSRIFKDIILRYKAMRGYYVPRRAGWDTHGLPIEIETEKQLGIKSKKEIEKLGIDVFNQKARESVLRYKDEWERFTERIGYWLDFKTTYLTCANPYIETLWWIFGEIEKRGFLKQMYKVVPWCPRCQTPLSSHELSQPGVYKKVKDPSVYVKFRLKRGRSKARGNEYLLVWTTTPWTLPANVAIAVNPALVYTKFQVGDDFIWSYNPPPSAGPEVAAVEKRSGQKLIGLAYEPLYPRVGSGRSRWYRVLAGDFIETNEGSGLVHIAPAFGEDDLALIDRELKIPHDHIPVTVDDRGFIIKGFPGAGKFLKEADADISADLERRGFMYNRGTIEHEYPHCWRCSHLLIYFARLSWFIEMSALRNELLTANRRINWIPAHIKDGRFGEWLAEAKDWSISRERYWGTPLPIWECAHCNARKVVGSLSDLDALRYRRNRFFVMRHGEADHNRGNWLSSGKERPGRQAKLTDEGRIQVTAAAKELKRKKINLIVTSPMERARQTARIVARVTGARVVLDERLTELGFGILNGKPIKEYHSFFQGFDERLYKAPVGGENLTEVKRRVTAAVLDIDRKNDKKNILIVGHDDPLWMLRLALEDVKKEDFRKVPSLGFGEYAEITLHNWPYNTDGDLDIHRPFVDELRLRCMACRGEMKRVKEVADVWFDSGAMPFAQWHYPFENKEMIDRAKWFPADYIAEAIDQTRGWFYTLLNVSVLLGRGAPYENVVCLELILDKYGQKMSKSRGNVVEPFAVMGKYGVDALRWYFYTVSDPADPKRFDEADLGNILRRFILLTYNSYSFWQLYAHSSAPDDYKNTRHVLDRWLLAQLNETIETVTNQLERYDIGQAARTIEFFADELSRWYIRRSRRRFQESGYEIPVAVLRHTLMTLSRLLAPFMPFFAEALYQSTRADHDPLSVHLTDWPQADPQLSGRGLIAQMTEVRKLSSDSLARRAEAGIKLRQPLAALKLKSPKKGWAADEDLVEIVKQEVNVKNVLFGQKISSPVELDTEITPDLYAEGLLREVTRNIQQLRHAGSLRVGDPIEVRLDVSVTLRTVIETHDTELKRSVGATRLSFGAKTERDATQLIAMAETKIDDEPVWLGIKKV